MKLCTFLSLNDLHLIFLTETWLSPAVLDSEIFRSPGFNILARVDREVGHHGGILIAGRNDLSLTPLCFHVYADFSASVVFQYPGYIILCVLLYNPPRSSRFRISPSELTACLDYHFNAMKCAVNSDATRKQISIVLGDLNLPDICWNSACARFSESEQFLTDLEKLDLLQVVDFPTHNSGNILDIVCVSHPHLVTLYPAQLQYSDHYPVHGSISLGLRLKHLECSHPSMSYSKSSLNVVSFSRSVEPLYHYLYINHATSFLPIFEDGILSALASSCAKKTRRRQEFPYYYSSHSIHLANKIRTLKRSSGYSESHLLSLELSFAESVELDEHLLIQNFACRNASAAFKFVRQFKGRVPLPTSVRLDDVVAGSEIECVNLFNVFFASVFS